MSTIASTDKDTRRVDMIAVGGALTGPGRTTFADVEDTEVELLASAIERYKQQGSFATEPLLSEEAWENLQNIMEEAGELPKHAPYEELVNTDIANEVIAN